MAESGLSSTDRMANQEDAVHTAVVTEEFPTFERVDATEFHVNLNELFEFGLQRLLDGLSLMIE
ncbi:TetR/AcrR family transcriptional regulator C-terminal domain-containing protein [Leifsonia sp. A12D58]|uniref:TetR/AcrR family transcriptional regulator C-terminal domain-containing protein n=1 Tax=Leifsonia sp. A12D58 TaxID=3397674 RepID=UPI0039E0F4A7